jgi:quaternary ammonium compound-resistance protein SugE
MAFKEMPVSIAFGAWTGLALIFNVILDTYYFKEAFSLMHFIFLLMILIGIIGLKTLSGK